jgi:hypothetical protein
MEPRLPHYRHERCNPPATHRQNTRIATAQNAQARVRSHGGEERNPDFEPRQGTRLTKMDVIRWCRKRSSVRLSSVARSPLARAGIECDRTACRARLRWLCPPGFNGSTPMIRERPCPPETLTEMGFPPAMGGSALEEKRPAVGRVKRRRLARRQNPGHRDELQRWHRG